MKIEGEEVQVGDPILVKFRPVWWKRLYYWLFRKKPPENGIYTVTECGSSEEPFVLKR